MTVAGAPKGYRGSTPRWSGVLLYLDACKGELRLPNGINDWGVKTQMIDRDAALRKVFMELVDEDAFSEDELRKRMDDFVFHITDCMDELPDFADGVMSVADRDVEDVSWQCFYQFFIHALNHLEAARLLVLPSHESPFLSVQPVLNE